MREDELSTYSDPSTSPAEEKITALTSVSKSLAARFSTPTVATVAREHSATLCSPAPPSVHSTTLQERMDLEMSVLRRQEAVLKLQEEYYTLKIKLMKKQMEESAQKDWCNSKATFWVCLWHVTESNNNSGVDGNPCETSRLKWKVLILTVL